MNRRQGFSLVELLITLAVFSLFGVIAMRLLHANAAVAEGAFDADNNAARFDTAVTLLRNDLAGSSSCESTQPGLLRIHRAATNTIDWRCEPAGLSRTQNNQLRTWNIGRNFQLKMDGAIVLLSSKDDPTNPITFAPGGTAR